MPHQRSAAHAHEHYGPHFVCVFVMSIFCSLKIYYKMNISVGFSLDICPRVLIYKFDNVCNGLFQEIAGFCVQVGHVVELHVTWSINHTYICQSQQIMLIDERWHSNPYHWHLAHRTSIQRLGFSINVGKDLRDRYLLVSGP